MNATAVLAESERRGIKLGAKAGKLVIDAPRGAVDDAFRESLAEAKDELILLLDPSAERWGPSRTSDDPSIHIPADRWRWRIACGSWPRWLAWHNLTDELMPANATAETIAEVQHEAYRRLEDAA